MIDYMIFVLIMYWHLLFGTTLFLLRARYISNFALIGSIYLISFAGLMNFIFDFQYVLIFIVMYSLIVLITGLKYRARPLHRFNPRYIANKFLEILNQQMIIIILGSLLLKLYSGVNFLIITSLIFLAMHIGLFVAFSVKRSLFFITITLLFGWTFFVTLLLFDVKIAFLVNIINHSLFYLIIAIYTKKSHQSWLFVK